MCIVLFQLVCFCQFDYFIVVVVNNGVQYVQVKVFCLFQFDLWWDCQFFFCYDYVNQYWVVNGKCVLQCFVYVCGFFYVNIGNVVGFGDMCEIGVVQFGIVGKVVVSFYFYCYKVQYVVIKDDDFYWQFYLYY